MYPGFTDLLFIPFYPRSPIFTTLKYFRPILHVLSPFEANLRLLVYVGYSQPILNFG